MNAPADPPIEGPPLLKKPQPYQRGSIMSPPPTDDVKAYKMQEARLRHEIKMQELADNPPTPRNPKVPVSTRVQTVPNDSVHLFSAPVDGEISDIRVMVNTGNFQEKTTLRFVMTSGNKTEAQDIEIEQNVSFEIPDNIRVKVGDEFSVHSTVIVSLVVTMMFRED